MNSVILDEQPSVPPVLAPVDAEVDTELLKTLPNQFEIKDAKSANWLVRRIVAAREYADHVKIFAEQERRRAEREEQILMFLFGGQIERWAKTEIERMNGRRKSIRLPGGTVGYRHVGPSLVIDDPEAVLRWARSSCPKAVVAKESVSKKAVNEHVEATGELPDGAHVEEARDKFFVTG